MTGPYKGLDADGNWQEVIEPVEDWVEPGECEGCGQRVCICKSKKDVAKNTNWQSFTERLRETEREIARNPELDGTTAEEWERIRQWPGEF